MAFEHTPLRRRENDTFFAHPTMPTVSEIPRRFRKKRSPEQIVQIAMKAVLLSPVLVLAVWSVIAMVFTSKKQQPSMQAVRVPKRPAHRASEWVQDVAEMAGTALGAPQPQKQHVPIYGPLGNAVNLGKIVRPNHGPKPRNTVVVQPDMQQQQQYNWPPAGNGVQYNWPASGSGVTYDFPAAANGVTYDFPAAANGVTYDFPAAANGVQYNWPASGGGVTYDFPAAANGVTYDFPAAASGVTYDFPAAGQKAPKQGSGVTYDFPAAASGVTYDFPAAGQKAPKQGSGVTYDFPTAASGEIGRASCRER